MAFLIKLAVVVTLVSVVFASPPSSRETLESQEDTYVPSYAIDPSRFEAYDLPTNLQLPKAESAKVPFYPSEISTVLKAPQFSSEPSYYEVPVPAQDLIAPIETSWNPENDPKYFYEVPAIISKQELPTNAYPKKFNKDLHSKSKPYISKPKQEITLFPIAERQVAQKQKSVNKVYEKLAKKANQRQFKVHKTSEPQEAATGFSSGFDSEGVIQKGQKGFTQGLSADLTSSLGITSPHSSSSLAERLNFHMVGHDGPHSYKWGYDTGIGHNRQFRYEERDKEGMVKGQFGFYDKHGKLQMVNYDASPHEGYHAEGNFGKYSLE